MNVSEFMSHLKENNLGILRISEDCWGLVTPAFANPLLHFDPSLEDKKYTGNVSVKSINIRLFSESQVRNGISLVDQFLQTPLVERELGSLPPIPKS